MSGYRRLIEDWLRGVPTGAEASREKSLGQVHSPALCPSWSR